jgi:hypothetical protein
LGAKLGPKGNGRRDYGHLEDQICGRKLGAKLVAKGNGHPNSLHFEDQIWGPRAGGRRWRSKVGANAGGRGQRAPQFPVPRGPNLGPQLGAEQILANPTAGRLPDP